MIATPNIVELAELDIELFNRLLKTGVMRANPSIKTLHEKKVVCLDSKSTEQFLNGIVFANYLIVLKEVLYKVNQDFAIDKNLLINMKSTTNA